ncbi:MAG: group 1 truncated hemoglobin [Rhodospirillales bacterium]|nr:group 1 truncated hemoglobin [Rhodospirillales bacterium]
MASTMFERYGGFASINKVVSSFYDKVLDSPLLSPYFEGSPVKQLIDHQTKFIAQIMGGPVSYSNDALQRAHSHLKIDSKSYDELVMLLEETLEDFNLEQQDIDIIKKDIMDRSQFIISN